ncbi:unnamed protein product [Arabis nemorensis]|uniref:Uncharacterized protein n=1 Tax=Arabis nemorensis TaxID=586526 RepID=A0A565CCW2_9BRAS|nr:unnamed protein product [Arabis nemorensis]
MMQNGNDGNGVIDDDLIVYSADEDYSQYGKVKDEDEDGVDMCSMSSVKACCVGQGERSNRIWSGNIYAKQSFAWKDEMVSKS